MDREYFVLRLYLLSSNLIDTKGWAWVGKVLPKLKFVNFRQEGKKKGRKRRRDGEREGRR